MSFTVSAATFAELDLVDCYILAQSSSSMVAPRTESQLLTYCRFWGVWIEFDEQLVV